MALGSLLGLAPLLIWGAIVVGTAAAGWAAKKLNAGTNAIIEYITAIPSMIFQVILDAVGTILYTLWLALSLLVDILEEVFRQLAGLKPVKNIDGSQMGTAGGEAAKEATTGQGRDLISLIIQTDTVRMLFQNIMIVSVALIMFFTIIQIIREQYKNKDGGNPYIIVFRMFRGMVTMLFVTAVVVVGLEVSGIVLRALDSATGGGDSVGISGSIFGAMSANASRLEGAVKAQAMGVGGTQSLSLNGDEFDEYGNAYGKVGDPWNEVPINQRIEWARANRMNQEMEESIRFFGGFYQDGEKNSDGTPTNKRMAFTEFMIAPTVADYAYVPYVSGDDCDYIELVFAWDKTLAPGSTVNPSGRPAYVIANRRSPANPSKARTYTSNMVEGGLGALYSTIPLPMPGKTTYSADEAKREADRLVSLFLYCLMVDAMMNVEKAFEHLVGSIFELPWFPGLDGRIPSWALIIVSTLFELLEYPIIKMWQNEPSNGILDNIQGEMIGSTVLPAVTSLLKSLANGFIDAVNNFVDQFIGNVQRFTLRFEIPNNNGFSDLMKKFNEVGDGMNTAQFGWGAGLDLNEDTEVKRAINDIRHGDHDEEDTDAAFAHMGLVQRNAVDFNESTNNSFKAESIYEMEGTQSGIAVAQIKSSKVSEVLAEAGLKGAEVATPAKAKAYIAKEMRKKKEDSVNYNVMDTKQKTKEDQKVVAAAKIKAGAQPGEDQYDLIMDEMDMQGVLSYQDLGAVMKFYEMGNMDFIIGFLGMFIVAGVFINFAFGLIQRLLELTVLYIMSPLTLAMYPIDNGQSFNSNFVQTFYKKVISVYAIILSMNIFFMLYPIFKSIKFFPEDTFGNMKNGVMSIFMTLALLGMLPAVRTTIQTMLGAEGIQEKSIKDVAGGALSEIKKGTTPIAAGALAVKKGMNKVSDFRELNKARAKENYIKKNGNQMFDVKTKDENGNTVMKKMNASEHFDHLQKKKAESFMGKAGSMAGKAWAMPGNAMSKAHQAICQTSIGAALLDSKNGLLAQTKFGKEAVQAFGGEAATERRKKLYDDVAKTETWRGQKASEKQKAIQGSDKAAKAMLDVINDLDIPEAEKKALLGDKKKFTVADVEGKGGRAMVADLVKKYGGETSENALKNIAGKDFFNKTAFSQDRKDETQAEMVSARTKTEAAMVAKYRNDDADFAAATVGATVADALDLLKDKLGAGFEGTFEDFSIKSNLEAIAGSAFVGKHESDLKTKAASGDDTAIAMIKALEAFKEAAKNGDGTEAMSQVKAAFGGDANAIFDAMSGNGKKLADLDQSRAGGVNDADKYASYAGAKDRFERAEKGADSADIAKIQDLIKTGKLEDAIKQGERVYGVGSAEHSALRDALTGKDVTAFLQMGNPGLKGDDLVKAAAEFAQMFSKVGIQEKGADAIKGIDAELAKWGKIGMTEGNMWEALSAYERQDAASGYNVDRQRELQEALDSGKDTKVGEYHFFTEKNGERKIMDDAGRVVGIADILKREMSAASKEYTQICNRGDNQRFFDADYIGKKAQVIDGQMVATQCEEMQKDFHAKIAQLNPSMQKDIVGSKEFIQGIQDGDFEKMARAFRSVLDGNSKGTMFEGNDALLAKMASKDGRDACKVFADMMSQCGDPRGYMGASGGIDAAKNIMGAFLRGVFVENVEGIATGIMQRGEQMQTSALNAMNQAASALTSTIHTLPDCISSSLKGQMIKVVAGGEAAASDARNNECFKKALGELAQVIKGLDPKKDGQEIQNLKDAMQQLGNRLGQQRDGLQRGNVEEAQGAVLKGSCQKDNSYFRQLEAQHAAGQK